MARPRITRVTVEVSKYGACAECGKPAVRIKTIAAETYDTAVERARLWAQEPVQHARCEP